MMIRMMMKMMDKTTRNQQIMTSRKDWGSSKVFVER